MTIYKKYIGQLYLTTRFYLAVGGCIVLFIGSFYFTPLLIIPKAALFLLGALLLADYFFLFSGKPPVAKRIMAERFSNGDANRVTLQVTNNMPFETNIKIIDELPVQLQQRDWMMQSRFKARQQKNISYSLQPAVRGEYKFGNIILYIQSRLGLLLRRHDIESSIMVPVYPSFMQLRKFQLLSQTTIQTEHGSKRMRKIGHSMEFEQIKEYVRGDDIRTINWKATARRQSMMVNNFSDEKSQQVYCIIDKGRLMKMPFGDLSLLDYAINSSLVLSNVCLQKQDRVGLITFANKMGTCLLYTSDAADE